MGRIQTFLQFILGVVVVGILVNLASDYLGGRFPPVQKLLVQLALMAVAVWAAILVTRLALSYLIGGRYAVEALILNAHDELLLYRHPQHKCMLPPGGRVKRSEFPDFALQLRLDERLGLSPRQYRFDERFHHGLNVNFGNFGEIQRFPAPVRAGLCSHCDFDGFRDPFLAGGNRPLTRDELEKDPEERL